MFDKKLKWNRIIIKPFIFKYPFKYSISRIRLLYFIYVTIINYFKISRYISTRPDHNIIIYFCPNIQFCIKFNIPAPSAIPYKSLLTFLIDEGEPRVRNSQIGHELAHILLFYWDREKYHLEILEEGMAMLLSKPKKNHHQIYKNYFPNGVTLKDIGNILKIDYNCFNIEYSKAVSFTKFFIQKYGLNTFKKLYLKSVIDRKEFSYFVKGKIISEDYLKMILWNNFNVDSRKFTFEWLRYIGVEILY